MVLHVLGERLKTSAPSVYTIVDTYRDLYRRACLSKPLRLVSTRSIEAAIFPRAASIVPSRRGALLSSFSSTPKLVFF